MPATDLKATGARELATTKYAGLTLRQAALLVYAGVAIVATLNLVVVYRMLTTPEYLQLFGAGPLAAQVALLLHSFRYEYSMGLTIFALHLIVIGGLIYRSSYIPKWLGVILVIDGLGWIVTPLHPRNSFPNMGSPRPRPMNWCGTNAVIRRRRSWAPLMSLRPAIVSIPVTSRAERPAR